MAELAMGTTRAFLFEPSEKANRISKLKSELQDLSEGGPHPTPREGGGPAQPGAGRQPAIFFQPRDPLPPIERTETISSPYPGGGKNWENEGRNEPCKMNFAISQVSF